MNGYQLYLENIINALARVGIHYPLKLESYEDLFYTAESLGSFLEINSFLQRVGEGYSIAGFDESITYRSYWYSEFYLEFQERVLTTDSYLSAQPELEDVADTVEEVEVEEVEEITTHTETLPTVRYSSVTGTNSDGFDEYGVPLDLEYDEELSTEAEGGVPTVEEEAPTVKEEVPLPVSDSFSYSEASGTSSDGFDYYGVDIDEGETETSEESEEVVVSSSSSEFDFPDEEVEDIHTNEEVVTTATLSSDGFDLYGVELEDSDDSDDSVGSDDDELDPDDPDSGVVVDLVGESVSESGGYSEGEYDEENDPDNPDNGNYVDTVSSGYVEYDEENDPDNPDNGNYVDTVSSNYEEYDEENDPDNPDNGSYVDTVSSSQTIDTGGDYSESRGSSEPIQSRPQQPKTVAQKNIESTQNILNILGKFEKTLLGKVKKDGKK